LTDPEGRVGSWDPMIKDSALYLILDLRGEDLAMAAHTQLTLLPKTSATCTGSRGAGLTTATPFNRKVGMTCLGIILPSEVATQIFGKID